MDLKLNVFSGSFQLPSIHQESLIALTYCKMAGIDVHVDFRDDYYFSQLPALLDNNTVKASGEDNIIEYLESVHYDTEFVKLSNKNKFETKCYKVYLEQKLKPCLLYLFWYDEDNYNENIGYWFAKKSPFPTNFLVPRSLRKEAIAKVEQNFSQKIWEDDDKVKKIEKKVITDAIECLKIISKRLATKKFLFDDDKPTTVDAYLFSYLALLYKLPVKKEIIKGHIRSTPNLQQYVDRILKEYFAKFLLEEPEVNVQTDPAKLSWKDLIFSGCVAAILMIYFAASNGIIFTNYSEPEDEEDEDEDEAEEEEEEEDEEEDEDEDENQQQEGNNKNNENDEE